ncbi:MAG: hypothetical protein ACYTGC_09255 [Planctomycetota bacterium]|jgi:hypothetical protein
MSGAKNLFFSASTARREVISWVCFALHMHGALMGARTRPYARR